MEMSYKQILLRDIEESTELYSHEMTLHEEAARTYEERVPLYVEAEKHLTDSADDEVLKQYIQRRVSAWMEFISETKKKVVEAKEKLEMLAVIRKKVEERKDDLTR